MKKLIILLVFCSLSFTFYAQSKFSVGTSVGVLSIKKETGINYNAYFGYHLKENLVFGIDGTIGVINANDIKTDIKNVFIFSDAGINTEDSKGNHRKFYFSGQLGLGITTFTILNQSDSSFLLYAGTKANINIFPKLLFGLKSGYNMNKIDNYITTNLFLTYKF